MRVDLHLHTVASDGLWTVRDIYEYVRSAEVELFSVTDHDLPQALDVPADLRSRYVPGVEVDCVLRVPLDKLGPSTGALSRAAQDDKQRTVHLLIYGAISADTPLAQVLAEQRQRRFERICQILARLGELDVHVDVQDVVRVAGAENESLGRPHIARALVQRGAMQTIGRSFERYLAEGRPAYVPLQRLAADEVIDLAHAARAIVIVAHPFRLQDIGDLDALYRLGVDGFEVRHPQHTVIQAETLEHLAAARGLLQTAGSDYHGHGKAPLPYELGYETSKALRDAILRTSNERELYGTYL
jgi:predicted metal-dependent phosphoesterase TrpH